MARSACIRPVRNPIPQTFLWKVLFIPSIINPVVTKEPKSLPSISPNRQRMERLSIKETVED